MLYYCGYQKFPQTLDKRASTTTTNHPAADVDTTATHYPCISKAIFVNYMGYEGSSHRYLKRPVNHYLSGKLRKVGYTYTPSAFKALLSVNTRQALGKRVHSITVANAARLVKWLEGTAPREVVHAFGWDTQGGDPTHSARLMDLGLVGALGFSARFFLGLFNKEALPAQLFQTDTDLWQSTRRITRENILHAIKSRDGRYKWLDTVSNWGVNNCARRL